MHQNFISRFFFLHCLLFAALRLSSQSVSLAGEWRFAIDRNNAGITEQWFNRKLADAVHLPGTMTENGKGDDVTLQTKWTGSIYDSSFFFRPSLAKYRQPDNLKIPFWLTPLKHYVGVAWYQRDIEIPAGWQHKQISLLLERSHIQTQAWIDGQQAGANNSLVAPHVFDLTKWITPGRHVLTIRIDNTLKDVNVGPDSHSVTDQTTTNWNGIVGRISLEAAPLVSISDVQVFPDINQKIARVSISVTNKTGATVTGNILLSAKSFNTAHLHTVPALTQAFTADTGLQVIEVPFTMGSQVQLWDEFTPALYKLVTTLTVTNTGRVEKAIDFGMREVKVNGTRIEVNGRPVFLRGTVNNSEFPLTGYAPMDEAAWRRVFTIAKAHGLNHMRFHSWCPPEAAFAAADKTGFYLQPEGPSWPNHGTSLGDGRFIDQYLYDETNRMETQYGNHPSYCMLSAGNEPAGRNHAAYLGKFVRYWQAKDKRRVYTGASVAMSWPLYPESDYMIKSGARGLDWTNKRPENQTDYRAAIEKFAVPYVTHEMGQWCVFPDFREIKKYTGITRARNFELFREDLADHGMADRAQEFLLASGKLQALCYKEEIEKSLRTPGLAGFQMLGLQDFPGQGTALVGVLDAFWDSKPYITAKQWSRFCNTTVPLSRISKFVYTNTENFEADIELYHFGAAPLQNKVLSWTVKDEKGAIVGAGKFPSKTYAIGNCLAVGKIQLPLLKVVRAEKLKLEVTIEETPFANDWDFWVYPETYSAKSANAKPLSVTSRQSKTTPPDIYYTDTLDAKAEEVLNGGGKVFLNAAGKVVKGKEVVMYFTPVFWNTSWFKMRPPHVTGIAVQASHPAFRDFPTESHSNLQWWEIVNRAQVMNLEDFPRGFTPLVQPIDTWFMNRRLGLILEARVGKGKLVVSSASLSSDTAHRIVARQLFYSIRQYMQSDGFNPKETVTLAVVRDLFRTPSRERWDSFTKDSPDELKPGRK
ncbi:MAG: beta-glucuronidase [Williamsia sp.]|nr:beta-glucuronidase [Williamsia sp.]